MRGESRAELVQLALSDTKGRLDMHVSGHADSSSLLRPTVRQTDLFPGTGAVGTETVDVATLDDVLARRDLPPNSLLKIDVQGHELALLHGATASLSRFRWVYVELSLVELYEGQPLSGEVISFLSAHNFSLSEVVTVTPRGGRAVQFDALFERSANGTLGDNEPSGVRPRAALRLVYFAPDAVDPALQRRIASLCDGSVALTAFSFERPGRIRDDLSAWWPNVHLGVTSDGAYFSRILAALRAFPILWRHRGKIRSADVLLARNIDMLVLARLFKVLARAPAPVVYEVLDVQPVMVGRSAVGRILRSVERTLLQQVVAVAVSSDAFVTEYFIAIQRYRGRVLLVENRLVFTDPKPPRCAEDRPPRKAGTMTIGWTGALRCRRSLALLTEAARTFPDTLNIRIHGVPNGELSVEELASSIQEHPNMSYFGSYSYPQGLQEIYGCLDVIWCGDFSAAEGNSRWLLPNRIYEGGYFGVPMIAPSPSRTADFIRTHCAGWVFEEPFAKSLVRLLGSLGPAELAEVSARILDLPDAAFVEDGQFARDLRSIGL
jgi:succinoglycan biosynthesis protein ExoL